MNKNNSGKAGSPLHKSKEEEAEEFLNVFNYFEEANTRNREAFIELLNYTIENTREPKKQED